MAAMPVASDLEKRIIKTEGALDYHTDITCIIKVRSDEVDNFHAANLPDGVFLAVQNSK